MSLLLAALGAGVGAAVRFMVGHRLDWDRPWGTLLVNVLGSTLLGALSALALSGQAMALLGAGFCGGLTTWSSLAVQSVELGESHGPAVGGRYLTLTLVLSLAGCTAGFVVVTSLVPGFAHA